LQERKLDFERMLAVVSDRVFGEERTSLGDMCGEIRIDRSVAERSSPGTLGVDGGFCPVGKMRTPRTMIRLGSAMRANTLAATCPE